MFDTLCIAFRGLCVNPKTPKKRDDDPVPPTAGLCQRLTFVGQKDRAVWFSPDEASGFEPRDVLGHGWRLYTEPLGDFDRSGLSARLDQFCDQLDVILRHLALVRLTHCRKPFGLHLGSPVDSFKCFTTM